MKNKQFIENVQIFSINLNLYWFTAWCCVNDHHYGDLEKQVNTNTYIFIKLRKSGPWNILILIAQIIMKIYIEIKHMFIKARNITECNTHLNSQYVH